MRHLIHTCALYAAPTQEVSTDIAEFFTDITLPSIPPDALEELASPITQQEIKLAIKGLNRNKTPGLDGLPVEFYQIYSDVLVPKLEELYRTAFELGYLPQSTMQALITSIPKPGRDTSEIANYRPLSLLATEYKILSKVLANRIYPYLNALIHEGQNVFLPNRNTSFNIRRLHYIMEAAPKEYPKAGCLALDLRQAITWEYMFAALKSFGIPDAYLKWVRLLYTVPTARARTGHYISSEYTVHRGTRQGCPFSPLLFVLALEPLAIALRRLSNRLGIPLDGTAHLTSIYADDILIYLCDLTAETEPPPTLFFFFFPPLRGFPD